MHIEKNMKKNFKSSLQSVKKPIDYKLKQKLITEFQPQMNG